MSATLGVVDLTATPRIRSLVLSTAVPITLENPYSGSGAIQTLVDGKPAYGIVFAAASSPALAGRADRGVGPLFQNEWLALTPYYDVGDSSILGNTSLFRNSSGLLMFDLGVPHDVRFSILDGWTATFVWLVAP